MSDARRTVVITGGSRGIGRAVALRFAQEKPRIIIVHYDADEFTARETVERLTQTGVEAESHRVDVSSYRDTDALFKDILSRFSRVDALVNNAGITKDALLMR
jgi:3-oxoacyl-[acyl-carrier protein] reductase